MIVLTLKLPDGSEFHFLGTAGEERRVRQALLERLAASMTVRVVTLRCR